MRMTRLSLVAALALLFASTSDLHAQGLTFGVRGGMSVASLDAGSGAYNHHRTLTCTKCRNDFADKIRSSRGVKEIDLVILPGSVRETRVDAELV